MGATVAILLGTYFVGDNDNDASLISNLPKCIIDEPESVYVKGIITAQTSKSGYGVEFQFFYESIRYCNMSKTCTKYNIFKLLSVEAADMDPVPPVLSSDEKGYKESFEDERKEDAKPAAVSKRKRRVFSASSKQRKARLSSISPLTKKASAPKETKEDSDYRGSSEDEEDAISRIVASTTATPYRRRCWLQDEESIYHPKSDKETPPLLV